MWLWWWFFLEGESQNVTKGYYYSTSIYLVFISYHPLTFTTTPIPPQMKKVMGRWRHSTEFRFQFGPKSWSTLVTVLIYSINVYFCSWARSKAPQWGYVVLFHLIQSSLSPLLKYRAEEVTCVWFGNYKVCPWIKYEGKPTNETERAWNLGLLVKCMLKSHFEGILKFALILLPNHRWFDPYIRVFLKKKKEEKSFRWIYLRRKRSFKTTAQGPGSTSEHGLSCYIFRIIPFIRGMRDISGILGHDSEL